MRTIDDYIDRAKGTAGIRSDRELCKTLGLAWRPSATGWPTWPKIATPAPPPGSAARRGGRKRDMPGVNIDRRTDRDLIAVGFDKLVFVPPLVADGLTLCHQGRF